MNAYNKAQGTENFAASFDTSHAALSERRDDLICIGDKAMIRIITKNGTGFGTCPFYAEDATRFVKFIMDKNPEIEWKFE